MKKTNVVKLTKEISKLSIKSDEESEESEEPKPKPKIKISPFEGGLNNNEYATKKEDNSLDLSKIFKNKVNIKTLLDFLDGYKIGSKNEIKGIILRGSIGCGKLTLIRACLKKLNFINLTYDTDYESEDIFDNLLLTVEAKGITKLFYSKQRKAIIIKDLDNALRPTQRSDFYKFLNSSKNSLPILMTSHDKSVGTLREVPKCILQLDFEYPTTAELVRHFSNEKISKNALEQIIHESRFDLRYIGNMIQGLEHSTKKVTIKKVENLGKDVELDTFNCIKFCSESNHSLYDKLKYSTLYTNSTVFHNYPKLVKNISNASKISDLSCNAEEMIQFAFENQDWTSFEEMYCYIGTIAPLNIIKNLDTTKLSYPSSNLLYNKDEEGSFANQEKDSMILRILIPKYFSGNKFTGKLAEFKKDMKQIKDPVRGYKLAYMLTDEKKKTAFLREFKKILKSLDTN